MGPCVCVCVLCVYLCVCVWCVSYALCVCMRTCAHPCSNCHVSDRELQEENRQTESERLALDRALQNEKAANQSQAARISRLEKDLRDLRVELEQKIEIGK